MPPRPKPRKITESTQPNEGDSMAPPRPPAAEAQTSVITEAKSMPPPPVPASAAGILVPEFKALEASFKSAIAKTDLCISGISQHAPYPPKSLTASLGRDLEKYDQILDVIESRLLRSIAVLQRDVEREQRRIKEEEMAAQAALPPPEETAATSADTAPTEEASSQDNQGQKTPPLSAVSDASQRRRPSVISLSSLRRSPFPHKLDLSSSALRISPEDAPLFNSGLTSPVTLAPKSARATNDMPDFVAAFGADIDQPIDLTLDEASSGGIDMDLTGATGDVNVMDLDLGNSAEKPIELDLDSMDMEVIEIGDMSDLFGDDAPDERRQIKTEQDLDSLVDVLKSADPQSQSNVPHEFFASLGDSSDQTQAHQRSTDHSSTDAMLADLSAASESESKVSVEAFDLDLDNFSFLGAGGDPHAQFTGAGTDVSAFSSGDAAASIGMSLGMDMDISGMEGFLSVGNSHGTGPGEAQGTSFGGGSTETKP